jgi:hypothetical protein
MFNSTNEKKPSISDHIVGVVLLLLALLLIVFVAAQNANENKACVEYCAKQGKKIELLSGKSGTRCQCREEDKSQP